MIYWLVGAGIAIIIIAFGYCALIMASKADDQKKEIK